MSQDIWNAIIPSTTSGNALATLLNDYKDAMVSGLSGSSRPANLQAGGYWVDITNDPTTWDYVMYDGTQDIVIFTINLTTGTVVLSETEGLLRIFKNSDSAVGPVIELFKKRMAGSGQTQSGDTLGEIDFNARTSGGVEVNTASIVASASQNITGSLQGTTLKIKNTNVGSATPVDKVTIADDVTVLGQVLATNIKKGNFAATTAPVVGSDNTAGYAVGSLWVNTVTKYSYICVDASTGAAIWRRFDMIPLKVNGSYLVDLTANNITAAAFTLLDASTAVGMKKLSGFLTSGSKVGIYTGAASSEVLLGFFFAGGGDIDVDVVAGTRLSMKLATGDDTLNEGYLTINKYIEA